MQGAYDLAMQAAAMTEELERIPRLEARKGELGLIKIGVIREHELDRPVLEVLEEDAGALGLANPSAR